MNLTDLQAELRHFLAERDRQLLHPPKNLSTALMVEAAELAEVFQWMTPEESEGAHLDPATKQRMGDKIADVLLLLLQVADHSQIEIAQAVKDKLGRTASKYSAKHTIARVSPVRASVPGTHVLLDYENVQPTENQLRTMVPDASQVWVFHGPHQRQVEQRFASFGADVTAVPISKTGKNALDFHRGCGRGGVGSPDRKRGGEGGLREGCVVSTVRFWKRVRCHPGLTTWCGVGWCGICSSMMWHWRRQVLMRLGVSPLRGAGLLRCASSHRPCRRLGPDVRASEADSGAVTLIQRFGSGTDLNLRQAEDQP